MYLAANGIIMGKAALDELQDGGNSVNPTNQYTDGLITTMLNAYNQTRIAGGRLSALMHMLALWSIQLLLKGCLANARRKHVMGMAGASLHIAAPAYKSLCR